MNKKDALNSSGSLKKRGRIHISKKKRADIIAKSDDSFGAVNYAEYSVKRKKEGTYKSLGLIVLFAYILFPVLLVGAAIIINSFVKGIGTVLIMTVGALSPLIIWILVYFTWPFFSQSYKYEIEKANINFTLHYGARYERDLYSCKVKDMLFIRSYHKHRAEADSYVSKGADILMCASSMSAADLYFAYVEQERLVIFFEVTEQSLKTLRYYNSEAVEITQTTR